MATRWKCSSGIEASSFVWDRRSGEGSTFGRRAREAGRLAFGGTVKVVSHGTDRYGRILGEVVLPDASILNERLVEQGWAWHYPATPAAGDSGPELAARRCVGACGLILSRYRHGSFARHGGAQRRPRGDYARVCTQNVSISLPRVAVGSAKRTRHLDRGCNGNDSVVAPLQEVDKPVSRQAPHRDGIERRDPNFVPGGRRLEGDTMPRNSVYCLSCICGREFHKGDKRPSDAPTAACCSPWSGSARR